jgi:hypothetical protein
MYTFIYSIHTFPYNIYIYIFVYDAVKTQVTYIIHFGTVHSSSTVVVLLHKEFIFTPSPLCNSASSSWNCRYATVSKPNITVYVTLHSPLFLVGIFCLISPQYQLSFTNFSLRLH